MKKKILCAILTAMLIISSFPFAVNASKEPSIDSYNVELASLNFDGITNYYRLQLIDGQLKVTNGKDIGAADLEVQPVDTSGIYTDQTADNLYLGMVNKGNDNVWCIVGKKKQAKIGLSESALKNDYFYNAYGKQPNYLKVEFKTKTNYGAHYMYWGSTEFVAQLSSGSVRFKNGNSTTNASLNKSSTAWHTYTCYIDLAAKKYKGYVDGAYVDEYTLSDAILAQPMNFSATANNGGDSYLSYITVSTIAPYGQEGISEYTNVNGDTKYGYVINNNTADTFTYGVYCAKFDANDELVDVVLGSDSVAANATELKNLTTEEAPAGGYCVYFVWEDLSTLKPLFEQKEVR